MTGLVNPFPTAIACPSLIPSVLPPYRECGAIRVIISPFWDLEGKIWRRKNEKRLSYHPFETWREKFGDEKTKKGHHITLLRRGGKSLATRKKLTFFTASAAAAARLRR